MKKLFLTLSTAALFGVAAMAQERDTAREESNQFRDMPQQQDTTGTEDYQYRMDTTSYDDNLQDTTGMSDQYRNIEEEDADLNRTIDNLNQELEEGEQNLEEGVQEGEQNLEEGVREGEQRIEEGEQNLREEGRELERDAEEAGNEMERGAEQARDTLQQSAEEAGEAMQDDSEAAMGNEDNNESSAGNTGQATASNEPVEVVDGKEGPNNEVVYEYKGEMFYVDRDKKEIVKVKRSDLKDSDHEVEVKDALADKNNDKKKKSKS